MHEELYSKKTCAGCGSAQYVKIPDGGSLVETLPSGWTRRSASAFVATNMLACDACTDRLDAAEEKVALWFQEKIAYARAIEAEAQAACAKAQEQWLQDHPCPRPKLPFGRQAGGAVPSDCMSCIWSRHDHTYCVQVGTFQNRYAASWLEPASRGETPPEAPCPCYQQVLRGTKKHDVRAQVIADLLTAPLKDLHAAVRCNVPVPLRRGLPPDAVASAASQVLGMEVDANRAFGSLEGDDLYLLTKKKFPESA